MQPVYLKYMDKMYRENILTPEIEKGRRDYYEKSLKEAYENSR
jgi:hypothetical protein